MGFARNIKAGVGRFFVKLTLRVLKSRDVSDRIWEIVHRPRNISLHRAENIEAEMYRSAVRETVEYIENHMLGVHSYSGRQDLLDMAFSRVTVDGMYLEFGVATGKSINFSADRVKCDVHGFDSFEGLPEDWIDGVGKGNFSSDGAMPDVRSNVVLHKGWFDETVPEFAETHKDAIAFMHVDSDIYSSAKTIFTHLGDRIVPGTVIQFDEYFNYPGWKNHEYKAFQELVAEKQLSYEYIGFDKLGYSVAVLIK